MSLAVKILLILNLVLAMVVAVVTMDGYVYSENWKRRWDSDTRQLTDQLNVNRDRVMELSFDRSRSEALLTAAKQRIFDSENKIEALNGDLTAKNSDINRLSAELSQKVQENLAYRESIQELSTSRELARQNASEKTTIAQVARAAAFQLNVKLAEVEDELNNAMTSLTNAEEKFNQLEKSSNQQKALLAILRERHPQIYNQIADEKQSAAFLQGIVAAIKTDPQGKQDMVVLTVGRNDKVEEGTEFIIYRGNKYIVRARVEKVLADMVSCQIIAESWNKDGLEVKQGDTAQNRL